jgi:hypothetical protein
MEIAKLYKDAGKSRRRDSIFRPYQGDYLDSLAGKSAELTDLKYDHISTYLFFFAHSLSPGMPSSGSSITMM